MTTPHYGLQDLLATAGGTDSWRHAIASVSDAYFAAQSAVIWRLAEAECAQIWERPAWPDASITRHYAEPQACVRAAQVLPETAGRLRREHAERARGDGITWEQIGEALGLDQGPDGGYGYDLGVAAFEHFADGPGLWYQASFHFRCASCGEYVTDRGPFQSHPEDNEQGHAEGCVRLAADIVGWQAQRDGWEADSRPAGADDYGQDDPRQPAMRG